MIFPSLIFFFLASGPFAHAQFFSESSTFSIEKGSLGQRVIVYRNGKSTFKSETLAGDSKVERAVGLKVTEDPDELVRVSNLYAKAGLFNGDMGTLPDRFVRQPMSELNAAIQRAKDRATPGVRVLLEEISALETRAKNCGVSRSESQPALGADARRNNTVK